MQHAIAAVAALVVTGCAANNMADLQANPSGVLQASSSDPLPEVVHRVAAGIQPCSPLAPDVTYIGPTQPADVSIATHSSFAPGLLVGAHLTPTAAGVSARIAYGWPAWRAQATAMQRLVAGQPVDC